MSGVIDAGEAFELTFNAAPGSNVTASLLDPDQVAVVDAEYVPEVPAGSGKFPRTFVPTLRAGMWTALFNGPGQPERYYVRVRALTGPPPLAAIGDVADQYGPMTQAQEGLAGHLVRAGSALLRQRARQADLDIDADVAAGRLDPELPALAVANMALRVLRNPNGLRAETTGPFSRTYDTSAAAGLLVVTADDLASVATAPAVPDGLAGLGIGTIRVTPGLAPPVRASRWGGPRGWV
jgi:hypothetical protein